MSFIFGAENPTGAHMHTFLGGYVHTSLKFRIRRDIFCARARMVRGLCAHTCLGVGCLTSWLINSMD
jgi:hypothetical protein